MDSQQMRDSHEAVAEKNNMFCDLNHSYACLAML